MRFRSGCGCTATASGPSSAFRRGAARSFTASIARAATTTSKSWRARGTSRARWSPEPRWRSRPRSRTGTGWSATPGRSSSWSSSGSAGCSTGAAEAAREGTAARLVLAADQFIIAPANRPADEAWARATGQDARSVVAGYPWFTDWGRDTMISLEGLTLCTGRHAEAAAILRTFRHYVKDGLVPNYFPEGKDAGVYHTADATLWFFHALQRYLEHTADAGLLRELWPALVDIVQHHLAGTLFHIHVDPADGLLSQGAEGFQLTWMDAKVDGWVVTPRRGKAVEINALWFNAVSLMADWARELDQDRGAVPRRAPSACADILQPAILEP